MCIEAMDTSSKHNNTDCLRKTTKPGSKLRWKLSRVFMEDEALKRCGASTARSIRKHLRREQSRTQLAKLAKVLGDIGESDKMESLYKEEIATAACKHGLPSGAMAPANTTQYLMGNVYEDMKTDIETVPVSHVTSESLSHNVNASLDADYDSCLAFQQRDFEELFDLCL